MFGVCLGYVSACLGYFVFVWRLKLQRYKLCLGDAKYFHIANFAHRKATGHQYQI